MPRGGLFADRLLADSYASDRPPVHAPILDAALSELGLGGRLALVLDVGCGAGASTEALVRREIAHRHLGIDRAEAMVRNAQLQGTAAFLVGAAGALPVESGSVQLMTAAGSLNYVDLDGFFVEAQRVLADDGVLLVYDFAAGRRTGNSSGLEAWFDEFLSRWPVPDDGARVVDRSALEAGPMALTVFTSLTVELEMQRSRYVDYVMTESNVAAAVHGGAPPEVIRRWCEDSLRPIMPDRSVIEFDSYYACLEVVRRPDECPGVRAIR